MLLVGCTNKPETILRLGTNIWPGYEPFYLARQQNILKEEKVRLVEFSSSSQTLQAYRNNLIDAAALTLDEVLLLLETGEKLKIALVMDISNGGDAIIGQANIKTLHQIKGKRIGVENNALGAYLISRALEIVNLNSNAITIIPLEISEQENAFLQKKVDAVVTFEPVRSKLLKFGGNILFDSRQLPGEIVDVLVIRDKYIEQSPQTVQYLIASWYSALSFMKKHPRKAAKILGQRMKLNIDEVIASYDGLKLPSEDENLKLLSKNSQTSLRTSAEKLMQLMLNQGLLKTKVNTYTLFSQ